MTVPPAAVDTAFVPGRTTAMVERVAASTHLTSSTGWVIPVDGGRLIG